MADKDEKSASISWLPLIGLIGVSSGFFLVFTQLTSSRPGGGEFRLTGWTFDTQTVDARLWQDPLGVAVADLKQAPLPGEQHSVTQFKELLLEKCFPGHSYGPLASQLMVTSGIQCPLAESLFEADGRFAIDFSNCYFPRRSFAFSRSGGVAPWKGFEEQLEQLQVLAVMIPGGPYVEDVERRIRSRRAVTEGLGVAGYAPEREHEIGYFLVPWHPLKQTIASAVDTINKDLSRDEGPQIVMTARTPPDEGKLKDTLDLPIPYEWYEPAGFGADKQPAHLLVLWLTDNAFRDAPIARLARLIAWFGLPSHKDPQLSFPVVEVLGPDNSGTLRKMVLEANDQPWNDETRQCLATTSIYSSQAAAAESHLTKGEKVTPQNCATLIQQKVRGLEPDSKFFFERTIPFADDRIVETLQQELKRRGVGKGDDVAIISEQDTYYARALCSTFMNENDRLPRFRVHSYTYLRGIDGKLPSDTDSQKETKDASERGDKNTQSSGRPTEQTEGLNQADDVRRLAQKLQELDRFLRDSGGGGLKAVGVLGSDVYDKLELLKALRPVLRQSVFFTNNLDARLSHPDEWAGTHNLIVVSALGLALPCQEVPPFRDSGQTALFAATLRAMGAKYTPVDKGPHIFEIGRNGPKELGNQSGESDCWNKGVPVLPQSKASESLRTFLCFPLYGGGFLGMVLILFCISSEAQFMTFSHIRAAWIIVLTIAAAGITIAGLYLLFNVHLPPLLRIGYFSAFGGGLLAWKYFVSRVTSAPPNTSSQARNMENAVAPGGKSKAHEISAWLWDQRHEIAASSWLAVPIGALLTVGLVWRFYNDQNSSGNGEPFAWFDGISAWPSIAIIVFAGLLSIHFTIKVHFDMRKNARDLTKAFGLQDMMPQKTFFFGWERPPLKPGIAPTAPRFKGWEVNPSERIDIAVLWQRYLRRGQLSMRVLRAAPMTVIYMAALLAILPMIGSFPSPPIRGNFGPHFIYVIMPTIVLFLFLTFVVIDAILLHEGFLNQLKKEESYWPDRTFEKFNYPIKPNRPLNESDLADYWDILLIAKRTEAVGGLIYYPFIILSLLIVARLSYFDNWTWPPVLIVTLSLHFALAFYAAWRLPKVAREYRDKVLGRLKRRKRQALMLAEQTPQAIDTMIEEVQSTHQGAFSNLWEQPAIRALLFPSSGIGLATLLQYLPH